jgi:hypothetical protein
MVWSKARCALGINVTQASACVVFCAGIRPFRGTTNQPGANRIPLDINSYSLKLIGSPNPVIERFILPERVSPSPQKQIRRAGRTALDPPGNLRQLKPGRQKQMDVIRHNDKSEQLIIQTIALEHLSHNTPRDFRLLQPNRPIRRAIQNPIGFDKRSSIIPTNLKKPRKRPSQSPRNEESHTRRMPMGKIASIHSSKVVTDRCIFLKSNPHRLKPVPHYAG